MLNKKSEANLEIARVCLEKKEENFFSVGVSRAYYSIFQATKWLIEEDKFMYKKYKQVLKKHVDIIKSTYPEVYIEVRMDWDEIFVCISSLEISDEAEYEDLIYNFIKEYHRKGLGNIFWGVDISLTKDNLHLIEDDVKAVKTPKRASA